MTYYWLMMQLHHGEKNIGLKEITPAMGIFIHPTLHQVSHN